MPIFPAAKTALELQGSIHFIPTGEGHTVFLFGAPKTRLPEWFKEYDWNVILTYTTTIVFFRKIQIWELQTKISEALKLTSRLVNGQS